MHLDSDDSRHEKQKKKKSIKKQTYMQESGATSRSRVVEVRLAGWGGGEGWQEGQIYYYRSPERDVVQASRGDAMREGLLSLSLSPRHGSRG